jgi:hypothetical protein
MRGTRRLIGTIGLLAVALAACERGRAPDEAEAVPLNLRITGDSVIQMSRAETGTIECPVRFVATAEGPEGEHVTLRSGRIDYYWWIPGTPAGSYEMSRDEVVRLWYDSTVSAGHTRNSHLQTFGQGSPPQPVRGEAWFEYATSTTDEVHRTETFRFFCYFE